MQYEIVRFETGLWGLRRNANGRIEYLTSTSNWHWHCHANSIIEFSQFSWKWQARRKLQSYIRRERVRLFVATVEETIDA